MNTSSRKLRQFGAPLLIMLLAATLGGFVQAIGVVAVVFIVVLVKRFGKFEAQLARPPLQFIWNYRNFCFEPQLNGVRIARTLRGTGNIGCSPMHLERTLCALPICNNPPASGRFRIADLYVQRRKSTRRFPARLECEAFSIANQIEIRSLRKSQCIGSKGRSTPAAVSKNRIKASIFTFKPAIPRMDAVSS
jgi:hypothetical protein